MNFSKHLYLIFLISILIPGLILSYISFRTAKDERILLEKSLENKNLELFTAVNQVMEKTQSEYLKNLKARLQKIGSIDDREQFIALATDLLHMPLFQSVAIYQRERMLFPQHLANEEDLNNVGLEPSAWPVKQAELFKQIQEEFNQGRYNSCIHLIRNLLHPLDNNFDNTIPTSYRFGIALLELKCLVALNLNIEAAQHGKEFIHALLTSEGFSSYSEIHFYLTESINLLNSRETLPREVRDYFWSMHERADIILSNAEFILQDWKIHPEALIRNAAEDYTSPMQIHYEDGQPFLIIGYPWVDQEINIIIRLNENLLVENIRSEVLKDKTSTWGEIDFELYDQKGNPLLTTETKESHGERDIALEKNLHGEFPTWKMVIFKKQASEVAALGHKKIILLYTVLGFSLTALLLGSFAVFVGLRNERGMVKMKSNFLSAVSHELKTPLTAIRMFAEIIESGKQTEESKIRRYAKLIGQESIRLQSMIEDILNFNRLEEKNSPKKFTAVTLDKVIKEVADLMQESFAKAEIKLQLNLDTDTVVQGDFHALRSVVQNLLENSLKYSPADTTVTVTLNSHHLILSVRDQGIGISGNDLKHIFDKFYRAGDELTRKTKGSGLGLTIVKQILDSHHASIKVNSKLNEGTDMIIIFSKGLEKHA